MPDETPEIDVAREFERAALQLAMYQNRLDIAEYGTAAWDVLDLTGRAAYLRDAKRTIGALGLHSLARRVELRYVRRVGEEGRRLASEREDLIAAGVNPATLLVPLHPEPLYDFGPDYGDDDDEETTP